MMYEVDGEMRPVSVAAEAGVGMTSRARAYYPVMLDLTGRTVVVIGGGTLAAQKVRELLDAHAQVRVVSIALDAALADLEREGKLTAERRAYRYGDLAGAAVAIAATDDRAVNDSVWKEACERNVLLNAVDDVEHCHFIAPAVHREGDITVTVSTAGQCPALAVRLRERMSHFVRWEHAEFARLAASLRADVTRRVPDFAERRRLWYGIVDSGAIGVIRHRDFTRARELIEQLVADAEREPHGY